MGVGDGERGRLAIGRVLNRIGFSVSRMSLQVSVDCLASMPLGLWFSAHSLTPKSLVFTFCFISVHNLLCLPS